MQKAKKYDWKDSNMALFGSDTEKQVKKESAESEPAWHGAGQKVGVKIWRVVQFQIEDWPEEDYGEFYEGDSYIILNTYKQEERDELLYDVHFWIGKHSTQDEYGTAAYKTVELDTYLDDKPVQHREVQNNESSLFKSYFNSISYMKGGAATGFRRVLPEEYTPRLLRFSKQGNIVQATEVARAQSRLQDGDVYLLDLGLTIYQWNGKDANGIEKYEAGKFCAKIISDRGRDIDKEVLEQEDISENHKFYSFLDEDDDDDDNDMMPEGPPALFKVSDADGSLDMESVKEGMITQEDLTSEDVYIIDTKQAVFVWVGNGASIDERKNGMSYAHQYLMKTDYAFLPITVLRQGQISETFDSAIPATA